jgi:hypothetical protein
MKDLLRSESMNWKVAEAKVDHKDNRDLFMLVQGFSSSDLSTFIQLFLCVLGLPKIPDEAQVGGILVPTSSALASTKA